MPYRPTTNSHRKKPRNSYGFSWCDTTEIDFGKRVLYRATPGNDYSMEHQCSGDYPKYGHDRH